MPPTLAIQVPAPPESVRVLDPPHGVRVPAAETAVSVAEIETERQGLAASRQALDRAAAHLVGLQDEVLRDAEAKVVDLAVAIAERVLMQEIDAGRYRMDPVVREALKQAATRREVVVRLNPEDLARMEAAANGSGDAAGPAAFPAARFVADATVRRAECLVETAEGSVEADLAGRLGQIRRTLTEGN